MQFERSSPRETNVNVTPGAAILTNTAKDRIEYRFITNLKWGATDERLQKLPVKYGELD